jgi:hypothetical protein
MTIRGHQQSDTRHCPPTFVRSRARAAIGAWPRTFSLKESEVEAIAIFHDLLVD